MDRREKAPKTVVDTIAAADKNVLAGVPAPSQIRFAEPCQMDRPTQALEHGTFHAVLKRLVGLSICGAPAKRICDGAGNTRKDILISAAAIR